MSKGTDKDIFGEHESTRIQTGSKKGGAPSINRDLARRLFQAGELSTRQIAGHLKCHVNTVRTIRRELEAEGLLEKADRAPGLSIVQSDFDEECRMAIGTSYAQWLKTRTKAHRRIFLFSQKTWEQVWDRPSLILTKDRDNRLGDQLCMKFLDVFGEDVTRMRNRKKLIRNLFRFLGRRDLCDRYLTMTTSRDPVQIKRIPEIEMRDFPTHLASAIEEINVTKPQIGLAVMLKLAGQLRTGVRAEGRGLMGIRVGSGHPSYIIMNGPDDVRIHVVEKMREEWDISWIPRSVRLRLWDHYQTRSLGEPLFTFPVGELRSVLKRVTLKHTGVELNPHDLRKVSITWLFVMGVPLELAVMINVGWKDLNTPKEHYLHMRSLLKKSDRKAYRELIPDWYKQGLGEYTEAD
jgi:hypothetical protein